MPSLKDATKKPANVGEQIEVAPIVAGAPSPVPYVPNPRGEGGLAVGSMGPAPSSFTTPYDSIRQFVRPSGVSQSRFPPLPTKANPATNAASSSVTSKQLGPVHKQVQANTAAIAAAGAQPGSVTGLAVSKSVFKDSTGVLRQALEISFTPPALTGDPTIDVFAGVSIWVTYPGDEPRGLGTGITSPVICQLPIDGSIVTLTVQSYSVNGVDNDFSSCPTINVTLDGVTTAPAAPTIASALAPCNSGLTFSWNIVSDPLHDVIDSYRVYRNTVNNSATATLIATIPQPATGTGTNVFTDVVAAGLVYYYWVSCENLQQLESTLRAAQSGAVQSGTIAYQGAYSGSITYFPGSSVTYSGQFYACILQSTGNLPTNATYWQSTGSSTADTFLGAWSSITPYVPGNQVTYSGGYYICTLASTNDQPDISPTYWQIVGSVNTYLYTGNYNNGTSYVPGNQVTYQGSYWICVSNTTGNAPSTTSSYWVLVGTSAILLGVYNGATAYVQGNEVTYLGNVYQCILASTGNLPTNVTYWQLTGTSSVLLGVYAGGTAYVAGNEVTYLGGTYKCILASTGNLPTNQTYWTLIGTNSQFLGAYSGSTAYVAGNQVTYQNNFYVCILASTGNAPTNATYWQLVNINNSTFLGAYNGSTAYIPGNQVTYNGNYYTCTAATTGNLPTNASYWQQIATSEIYLGAYNGSTAYVAGNQVSYLGSFWICILASTGNAPSIASSYWTLLGTSTILIGAYAGGTAYLQGMEVTYNGNIFQALQATTGNTPPTPPATSAYWQLVGPATLDNLADGSVYGKRTFNVGDSVIQNGNFESSATILPPPGYSTYSNHTATYAYDTSTQYAGTQSLKITASATVGSYGGVVPLGQVYCEPGDTFYASAYAKVNSGGGHAYVQVSFRDATGTAVGQQVEGTTSSSWTFISNTYTAPAGTVYATFELYGDTASGVVEFDNHNVTFVSELGTDTKDGPANFSATASTLTYRPLTNPLTATDAGSSATVSIAAFTMRTSSKGDINENSGSVVALSYSTLYYIYFDDATLAGGAVTYHATTTKTTALGDATHTGRFFVGSIITPAAGASDTVGNNDGGVGAQSGGTAVYLGNLTASSTVGSDASITNASSAIDGNLATYATVSITSSGTAQSPTASLLITGFQGQQILAVGTLYIRSSASLTLTGSPTGTVGVKYSLDGGANWTTLYTLNTNGSHHTLANDSISLPIGQNVGLIQIKVMESSLMGSSDGVAAVCNIYESWVQVVN